MLIYRAMFRLAGSKGIVGVPLLAAIAALISVPLAAMGFVLEFCPRRDRREHLDRFRLWAMLGTHLLIGIGEGLITFFVVGAVMRARPDLVYGSPTFTGARSEELVS